MTWHLLTTDYPPTLGGVATWSRAIAQLLTDAGETVRVHSKGGGEGPIPVVRMWGRSWRKWQGVWAAASVWPRWRAGDVILAATWPLAVHLTERPLIVAYHGSDLTRPPPIAGRDRVVRSAVNLPVSRFLGAQLGAPHTVLPYPIAVTTPARRGGRILVVARLVASKGVDTSLRFAARLGRPITVVGDGPERAGLEHLATTLGLDARFTGAVPPDAIPWDEAWALTLFSREDEGGGAEGLGLVLLEAAARGVPSFGTRVGGVPEAASVVLDDPLRSDVPEPPGADEVQGWLAATHGPARTLAALRAAREAADQRRRTVASSTPDAVG